MLESAAKNLYPDMMADDGSVKERTAQINERVRAQLKILRKQYETQGTLADALGVPEPTLSAYMTGRSGMSFVVWFRVAALSSMSVWQLTGLEPPATELQRENESDPIPERAQAVVALRVLGIVSEDTIRTLRTFEDVSNKEKRRRDPMWWFNIAQVIEAGAYDRPTKRYPVDE